MNRKLICARIFQIAMNRLSGYTHYFVSHGSTIQQAHHQAIQVMDNIVVKQSSQMSFSDTYLIVGIIFLATLPMLLFAAGRKAKKMQVILTDH
jgi:DHA2 family multidrug resistance protein